MVDDAYVQVFISHSSIDKPLVRRIVAALEQLGLSVWLDEARIRVGESIPEAVASALQKSDLLVLGFSEAALASRWVSAELNTFFMQAMRDQRPILPCRFDASEPPTLLSHLKYADFSASFDEGMAALQGAVGIAEEIAEQHLALDIAQRLELSIGVGFRHDLYKWFLCRETRSPFLTTQETYDRLPKIDRRNFESVFDEEGLFTSDSGWHYARDLEKKGLITNSSSDPDWRIRTWLMLSLTPLGVRVFSRWRPKDGEAQEGPS